MNVVVVGGGKLGYYLTRTMLEEGHKVSIIEQNKGYCYRLANELDIPVICGDGTRVEYLRQGIGEGCDCLIAATSRDEDNLIACELAKHLFHVRRTVARANNPKNTDIMRRMGVDITVCPTQTITDLIEHEIDGAAVRFITNVDQGEAVISEYTLPANWSQSGTSLRDLDIPDDSVVICLMRGGTMEIPRGNSILYEGDEVIALTVGHSAKKLKKLFEL